MSNRKVIYVDFRPKPESRKDDIGEMSFGFLVYFDAVWATIIGCFLLLELALLGLALYALAFK